MSTTIDAPKQVTHDTVPFFVGKLAEDVEFIKTTLLTPQGQPALRTEIVDTATLEERLNVSEPTIIRLRKKGKIPHFFVGGVVRYVWEDVLKALQK